MAVAAELTPGAVTAIADHADGTGTLQPVLQVVDLRMVNVQNDPSAERFRLELSDGVYSLKAMLAAGENPRVRDYSIRYGSIIRLREFTCSTIRNRRLIVVLQLDVLQSEHDIIGNSKPFDMNNVRTEQRSGTNSVDQGMVAEIPRETVSEITNVLGYLVKPVLFTVATLAVVKATLSVINFLRPGSGSAFRTSALAMLSTRLVCLCRICYQKKRQTATACRREQGLN